MKKSARLPKSLTTVTLFSKILAFILLVFIFPLVGFYIGMLYQRQVDLAAEVIVVSPTSSISPTPRPHTPVLRN